MKLLIAASAGLLLSTTGAQAESTIYSNDFTTQTGTGTITGTGSQQTTPSGQNYFQLAQGSNTGLLTIATAGYTGLNFSFDLYAINSLDGNNSRSGALDGDAIYIYLNGATTPTYDINASNVSFESQDFNGVLAKSGPGNSYGAQTGAVATGTLGYGYNGLYGESQDATYHLTFALPDTAITTISFMSATDETADNEAYGLDNLSLTGQATVTPPVGAVPEPASWAMLITGFGLVGAGMRYRRKRVLLRYV